MKFFIRTVSAPSGRWTVLDFRLFTMRPWTVTQRWFKTYWHFRQIRIVIRTKSQGRSTQVLDLNQEFHLFVFPAASRTMKLSSCWSLPKARSPAGRWFTDLFTVQQGVNNTEAIQILLRARCPLDSNSLGSTALESATGFGSLKALDELLRHSNFSSLDATCALCTAAPGFGGAEVVHHWLKWGQMSMIRLLSGTSARHFIELSTPSWFCSTAFTRSGYSTRFCTMPKVLRLWC